MIYAELGIGNPTPISTEVERGSLERRISGLLVKEVVSIYLRVWIGRRVVILDSVDGVKIGHKTASAFKLLIGIRSTRG